MESYDNICHLSAPIWILTYENYDEENYNKNEKINNCNNYYNGNTNNNNCNNNNNINNNYYNGNNLLTRSNEEQNNNNNNYNYNYNLIYQIINQNKRIFQSIQLNDITRPNKRIKISYQCNNNNNNNKNDNNNNF